MSDAIYYHKLWDAQVREEVIRWWKQLHGLQDEGGRHFRVNQRGARAELRRSDTLDAVLLTEGFRNLWQALGKIDRQQSRDMIAWACVAAALAEVRQLPTEKTRTFAQCLGAQKEKTGKPLMSELRFAQLQKSHTGDDFLKRLRRALALINKTAPVLSLTDNILHWFGEQQGNLGTKPMDRLAARWASDYFTAVSIYEK